MMSSTESFFCFLLRQHCLDDRIPASGHKSYIYIHIIIKREAIMLRSFVFAALVIAHVVVAQDADWWVDA